MRLTEVQGKVDFGIITVREDEFEAVLARFPATGRVAGRRHYNLCRVDLPGGGFYLGAVLRCIEQGNGEAQSAAHDLLEDLQPRWVLVVGIAGGVPSDEFCLGDVIVSTRIHDFSVEAVLQESKPEYALTGGPVDRNAAVLVANIPALRAELGDWNTAASIAAPRPEIRIREAAFYGGEEWSERVRKALSHHTGRMYPRVFSGAIASSDRLIKDTEVLAVWTKMTRQVLAAEMESAGVYRATYGRHVPALSIRGLSDIVGLKRESSWTQYACHTAAAFAHALVRTRPFEPGNPFIGVEPPKPRLPSWEAPTKHALEARETVMSRPRVFIGTSTAGLEIAEFIQLGLDSHAECTVEPRPVRGLLGASPENLARTAQSLDFAILVLTPGDLVHGRDAKSSQRDSILLELGFFMGALGRERTCLVYCRDELIELPGDLAGVPVAKYGRRADGNTQAALRPVCTEIKLALARVSRTRESGSEAPGNAALQRMSSELAALKTELSAQAAHMRQMLELLTSERELSPERGEASWLRSMEGAWKNPLIGSWGYARFLGGELRFAYCYGGNDSLTGEYYNWHFINGMLCARFRWFDRDIEGFGYFEDVSANRLRGGWWHSRDVPEKLLNQLPHVRGMTSIEWVRQEDAVTPDWAEAFFGKIERMLTSR